MQQNYLICSKSNVNFGFQSLGARFPGQCETQLAVFQSKQRLLSNAFNNSRQCWNPRRGSAKNFFGLQDQHSIPTGSRCNVITFALKRDSSYYTDKDKVVSITYEEIGLFPRSFSRVLDRFLKQLFSDVDNLVIQEYRFYRYLFLTTIKTIFILFFLPFVVNFAAKHYIVKPITEYFWNTSHPEIFLNSYEQKRAFAELENFEEKLYFETLVESHTHVLQQSSHTVPKPNSLAGSAAISFFATEIEHPSLNIPSEHSSPKGDFRELNPKFNFFEDILAAGQNPSPSSGVFGEPLSINILTKTPVENQALSFISSFKNPLEQPKLTQEQQLELLSSNMLNKSSGRSTQQAKLDLAKIYQEKTIELATYYNNHSIEAITNFFADLLSLCTLLYLLITLSIQINITKSFLLEVFFGLDDSKKSLLILLITDLLVGYHSSNLWELFFEFIFNHYGIPESQTGIFLLVATLPVLLDVLFKYLIFRHLNRSSPATVATYQAIIE
uniref:Envelope membrane protein n=1 Tax=Volvulina compacta TaxID=51721 RepID=A0A6C0RWJ6_9CHLO|nr:envelope membrane protein [Volvulina compacta]